MTSGYPATSPTSSAMIAAAPLEHLRKPSLTLSLTGGNERRCAGGRARGSPEGAMDLRSLANSPRNERGHGQVSHLLLAKGEFGSQHLCVTWVECQPGSQQPLHAHPAQEQVYVIVRGQGQMLVAGEVHEVSEGTLVFVPPATPHAIRNDGQDLLVYVSATAPPFGAEISGPTWEPRGLG
jgi:mannose-6-phosphate isomerase-like protein (cupin superfamily)